MVKASPLIRDSRIVRDRYSGDVDGRPNIQVRVVVEGASTRKPIWNGFASFICSRDIRSNDVGASLNAYCSNSISIFGIGSPFRVRISGIATIGPTEDILNTTGVIKNVSAAKATIMSRMRRIFTDILLSNVPSDLSLPAFGIPPARVAESAGGMPKVQKGQESGRLAR